MCKRFTLWWETLDGERIAGEFAVSYEVADFTDEQPTCMCWIGSDDPDGRRLREHFVETALKPLFKKSYVGRIVIEVV